MKKALFMLLSLAIFLMSSCSIALNTPDNTPGATDTASPSTPSSTGTQTISPTPEEPQQKSVPSDDDLVLVADYIPGIFVELKYSTAENFTGNVIYDFSDAYLRYGTVKKLALVQEQLAEQGCALKIWDAYRPISAQHALWQACPDPVYVVNPNTSFSSHSRANTVDVTLVLSDGSDIEMPTDFDDFSSLADRDYSDVPAVAALNAKLLEEAMLDNGFKGYSEEWWHFSDNDKYPVMTDFDDPFNPAWEVFCNESLSLRTAPDIDAGAICTILTGEPVIVEKFSGLFAKVRYGSYSGYILSSCMRPSDFEFDDELSITEVSDSYSYEQMLSDIDSFCEAYPSKITKDIIGYSEEGREIPVLIIGDLSSDYHVLIQGAMHGREHATACVIMSQIEYILSNGNQAFSGSTVDEMMQGVCFHVIPMSNPDGVIISQSGFLNDEQRDMYRNDLNLGLTSYSSYEYALLWKANANGVDLNRNFDAEWASVENHANPSAEKYKGGSPLDQSESAALAEYTMIYDFSATISYHSSGSLIYYEFGDDPTVIQNSLRLAEAVNAVTGYDIVVDDSLSAGGYKDWAMSALKIPSITIEIGCENSPLFYREYYTMYERNKFVMPQVADWVKSQ